MTITSPIDAGAPWGECVDDVPRRLAPAELLEVLRGLHRDAATYRSVARHTPEARWFQRVAVTDCYDIWLLGWDAHQDVALHDHGGSAGGFLVVEGELVQRARRREGNGALREEVLSAGEAIAFGSHQVHAVANPSDAVATSVHVYSPPLASMEYFEPAPSGMLVATHSESAFAPRPAHARVPDDRTGW